MRAPIWLSSVIAVLAVAACASEPSGQGPSAAAPAPPPPIASEASPSTGNVAAPGVSVGQPAAPAPAQTRRGGDVVVPGTGPERPISPSADTRTDSQRMADIRAWDRCVTQAQSIGDSAPTRPQLDSPEEICRRSLGMTDRLSVPASRH